MLFLLSVLVSDWWTKNFFLPGWKAELGEWESRRGARQERV